MEVEARNEGEIWRYVTNYLRMRRVGRRLCLYYTCHGSDRAHLQQFGKEILPEAAAVRN
jgi:hypothetical protein